MGIVVFKEVLISKEGDNSRKVREIEELLLSVAIEPSKGISP